MHVHMRTRTCACTPAHTFCSFYLLTPGSLGNGNQASDDRPATFSNGYRGQAQLVNNHSLQVSLTGFGARFLPTTIMILLVPSFAATYAQQRAPTHIPCRSVYQTFMRVNSRRLQTSSVMVNTSAAQSTATVNRPRRETNQRSAEKDPIVRSLTNAVNLHTWKGW